MRYGLIYPHFSPPNPRHHLPNIPLPSSCLLVCFNNSQYPLRAAPKCESTGHPLELGKPTSGPIRTVLPLATFLFNLFPITWLFIYFHF